jgi:hypothetical protein
LGIGDWAQSPIPNPQSPIPNPQIIKSINPFKTKIKFYYKYFSVLNNLNIYEK